MLYARIYFPGLVQGWMLSKDQIPSLSFRKLSYNLLIKIVKNSFLSQAESTQSDPLISQEKKKFS